MMRVLMLGWEFPPFISGGLGTACYGLTKALSAAGTDVTFVLPKPVTAPYSSQSRDVPTSQEAPASSADAFVFNGNAAPAEPETPAVRELRLADFEHVSFRTVDAIGTDPYARPGNGHTSPQPVAQPAKADVQGQNRLDAFTQPTNAFARPVASASPAPTSPPPHRPLPANGTTMSSNGTAAASEAPVDLFGEVDRYATQVVELARNEAFDVVHGHDWMTFPAAMAVAAATGRPLVVHVHSTEFDRSPSAINDRIYDIERRAMHAAMRVIAVSHFTKALLVEQYGVPADRVEVVYNAIDVPTSKTVAGKRIDAFDPERYDIKPDDKIVLFLGRITQQKGPEYFIAAAKQVLMVLSDVKFVMAGSGDLVKRTVEMAAQAGIGHKLIFTGFLRGDDVDAVYQAADLYVMPSVSEPFGIATLEAAAHGVPVIVSKQSGVSEVLDNVLKVDFWDTTELANKIVNVLKRPVLGRTMSERTTIEVKKLTWADAAAATEKVYEDVVELVP